MPHLYFLVGERLGGGWGDAGVKQGGVSVLRPSFVLQRIRQGTLLPVHEVVLES